MKRVGLTLVSLVLGIVLGHSVIPKVSLASTNTQIEISIQDRQQIHELISRYGHTWDGKDSEAWSALFTDDAIKRNFAAGKLTSETLTNMERLARAQERHAMFAQNGTQTRHFQTNTLLASRTDGSVTGETVFWVSWQRNGEEAPRLVHTGVYLDEFVETASGWKFARREVRIDHK